MIARKVLDTDKSMQYASWYCQCQVKEDVNMLSETDQACTFDL